MHYPYCATLDAWNYLVRLRSDTEQALQEVLARLPVNLKLTEASRFDAEFTIVSNSTRRQTSGTYSEGKRVSQFYRPEGEELWEEAEGAINLKIASYCPDLVFVHAGVVAYEGKCIVIPGRSRAGKSELTQALVRSGAVYFSDEYAVLDKLGQVHPYARALSQRGQGESRLRTSASELGFKPGQVSLPVGAVVITKYVPNRKWKPRAATRGQAVWEMFHNTVSASINPQLALEILPNSLKNCAHCYDGPRGDADETARAILKTIGERS
ncbi:hypothetical protein JST97_07430 [bacterium]|nr:hypothetical protein [bacterium]